MRWLVILRTLVRYRLDELLLSSAFFKRFKVLLYLRPWHYFPIKSRTRGERIRLALEELGPIFIKFGQTLSTRLDLLPDDIGDELAKLQDACPPFDPKQAKRMIESALGSSTENLFKSFEESPLASASIAQVHTATTFDNQNIAIKVLRPEVETIIKRDLKLMFQLARFINRYAISKKLRPIEIVAEFESIIIAELDLSIEAQHCQRLSDNFKDSDLLYVPKLYPQFCAKNVLTTERIYGIPVGDIDALKANNIDMRRLAEEGVIIFFTQVFEHNFFHADMHPGNIFVGKSGQYIGVDFGIMGSLSEQDKDFIAQIFLAFFNQDYQGFAKAYLDSGWVSATTDIIAFEQAIERICGPMFEKPLSEISFGRVLLDLIQEAKNFDISMQPQLLLLDKTLLNIEGLGRQLYPQLDLWATAKPFLENFMQRRYNMKNTFEKLKQQAPKLLKEVPELPALAIDALKQLTKLRDFSALQAKQTEAIVAQLKNNASHQTNAIFASALVILAGVLAANALWVFSAISAAAALIFWFKSK